MNRCEDKVTKTFHGWLVLGWDSVGSWLNLELWFFLKRCALADRREALGYFLNLILKPFNSPTVLPSLDPTVDGEQKKERKKRMEKSQALNDPNFRNYCVVSEEHGLGRVFQSSLMRQRPAKNARPIFSFWSKKKIIAPFLGSHDCCQRWNRTNSPSF